MKTNLYLTFIFITLLSSCTRNELTNPSSTNIVFTEIGKGSVENYGFSQSNFVIDNQTDWQNLMSQMTTYVTDRFTETNIDFNRYMLLVVILDLKPSAWEVSFSNVVESPSRITATTVSISGDATVETQPFCIVKIPKSNKSVVFIQN